MSSVDSLSASSVDSFAGGLLAFSVLADVAVESMRCNGCCDLFETMEVLTVSF
jgi:hypothetical protein